MSEFGDEIDVILKKDGRDWTPEDSKKINPLIKNNRERLKQVRKELRG